MTSQSNHAYLSVAMVGRIWELSPDDNEPTLQIIAGFTVVGPDYLCGDTLDNQQKANPTWRIKEVFEWATIKRSMAEKSFSKWLEAVKAIFG